MNSASCLGRTADDFLSAVQFLTRVPVPSIPYRPDSLARAIKFFPLVGILLGAAAALLHRALVPHLGRLPTALVMVIFLVWSTGCLHEDGLADTADGLGGGRSREQILLIFRDSRIGSYGVAALSLSLLARVILIASIPLGQVAQYLIAAHILCRWTTLPLSSLCPPARKTEGQGARVAHLVTGGSLLLGTVFSFLSVGLLLRWRSAAPLFVSVAVTLLSARYYRRRIGGVTGDCFGATNQLTEIAVYLCGAWLV
jgi:adenosylcobinamide-GDP ribazoletransferase